MPLTDRAIKNARPEDKPKRLYDERGLYLEVSPAGGKLWRLKYRWAGREKRLAFGAYPDVSLKDARERRDAARSQLAKGVDPGEAGKAEKAARSGAGCYEAIAREWHAKQSPTLAESHAKRTLRRLEANVFPWLGKLAPDDIGAPMLLEVLERVEKRGAGETAHRIRSICSQVFRYAIATGRAKADPAAPLRGALAPVEGAHFPSVTAPAELAGVLRAIDGYRGTLVVRNAVRLQALLFVRPGELRHMRWADLHLDAKQWCYLVTKTDTPHIVPLASQAVALLEELRPLTGRGQYVFPSTRTADRPISENTVNAALRRAGIDTRKELTGHGFRAAARTILEEKFGYRPEILELQLAHTVKDPNGRAYNRTTHVEERTRMMQAWADFLDRLRTAGVVDLDEAGTTK